MRLFVVLPRHAPVDREIPNSVDLCVRDLVGNSRYRAGTRIITDCPHDIFDANAVAQMTEGLATGTNARVRQIARKVREAGADLVIVHQQFQVAAGLAAALPGRVVFHAHGFFKSYASHGLLDRLRRRWRRREVERLAAIVHVSDACRQHFRDAWPDVTVPDAVVHNGLDFAPWQSSRPKLKEMVCVGRCIAEKGILEAARAVVAVLRDRADWSARFILSEPERQSGYMRQVQDALAAPDLDRRVKVETNVAWAGVKDACERAAIALVPSLWREPFGRTALEAHAGGAAVVSSGTGGLAEVSGPNAVYADPRHEGQFAAAVRSLVDDERRRADLGASGAAHVRDRFDIARLSALNDQFYERLVTGARLRSP